MNRIRAIFWIIFSVSYISMADSAPGPTEDKAGKEENKFQPGEMIMHHITDSHEWHVCDWKGKHISIPLPIILFHKDRGLDVFMSSKFHHGKKNI